MTNKVLLVVSVPLIFAISFWNLQGSTVHAAQAGADEGLVVFHRANVMKGKAILFNIEQDGRPIGQLRAGTTLEVPLAPGTYTFTVRAPSIDGMDYLTLSIEAGKTYSVEGEILWGWPAAAQNLAMFPSPGWRRDLLTCHPLTCLRQPRQLRQTIDRLLVPMMPEGLG